jgi:phosphoribosylpyrophosphate synthetase
MNNNSEQLSELLFMISCCKRSSAKKVNLILPYMPYSNYDKFGNHSYFPTSDIAKLIETAGAD